MESQSSLKKGLWLEKYGNYNISGKVAIREHGEFKYYFRKSILSKS